MNESTANFTGGNSTVYETFWPCFHGLLENNFDYDLAVTSCSHLPAPHLDENRKVGIIAATVGTVALLMNGAVLAGVLKNRHLSKPMHLFVANLATADCAASFFSFFFCAIFQTEVPRPLTSVRVVCTFLLVLVLSAVSVVLLSVDRYLAILHPIFYQTRMSKRHVAVSLGIAWPVCVLVCLSPAMGWNCIDVDMNTENCIGQVPVGYLILINIILFMAVVIVIFINVRIFIVLKRRISRTRPMATESPQDNLPAARRREQRLAARKFQHLLHSQKKQVTVVIIAAVFVISWLPLCIDMVGQFLCFAREDCEMEAKPYWGMLIGLCSSVINPVVYALRIEKIRDAMHRRARRLANAVREKFGWSSNQVVNIQVVGAPRGMGTAGPSTGNRTDQPARRVFPRRPTENPRNAQSSSRPDLLFVAPPKSVQTPAVEALASVEDIE